MEVGLGVGIEKSKRRTGKEMWSNKLLGLGLNGQTCKLTEGWTRI